MLSQPGLPIVLAAIISSILSGTLLIINNIINNKFQLEREKQQGIRQQENDQKKWYREKIYDSYKTSIQVLTKILQERHEMDTRNYASQDEYISLENLYFEFNSEFEMIIAGYPDKDSEEFKEKMAKIRKYMQEKPLIARSIITEMMQHDSRIKNISE
jgi:sensor domain CHASE-containing protein